MSRLQRTLVEEVRTYAKAQSFDLVLTPRRDLLLLRHTTSPRRYSAALQARGGVRPAPASRRRPRQAAGAGQAGQVTPPARASAATAGLTAMAVSLGELAVRFGCELRGDPQHRASSAWRRWRNADAARAQLSRQPALPGAARRHRAPPRWCWTRPAPPPVRPRCWCATTRYATYARIAAVLHPAAALRAGRACRARSWRQRAHRSSPPRWPRSRSSARTSRSARAASSARTASSSADVTLGAGRAAGGARHAVPRRQLGARAWCTRGGDRQLTASASRPSGAPG